MHEFSIALEIVDTLDENGYLDGVNKVNSVKLGIGKYSGIDKNAAVDQSSWTKYDMPSKEIIGIGLDEAPRGSLGHWVRIKNKLITHYQIVVPTTWNASRRDAFNNPGAYEASLVGVKLANASEPLEILRTVHSFDPCLACAVHIIDPKTNEIKKYKIC